MRTTLSFTGVYLLASVAVSREPPPLASADPPYGRWYRRAMGREGFIRTWPSTLAFHGVQGGTTSEPRPWDFPAASLSVSGSARGPPPPLPRIPLQWSAPLTILAEGDTYTGGRINQDTPGQRYALSFVERVLPGSNPLPLPPGTGQNWTQVVNSTMASMQQNGVCRPEGGRGGTFTDLFAWVNHASTSHFEGATVYKGRACNVWASTADPKTAPLKLCVDATTSDPVVLDMHQGTVLYEFGSPITRGPPPESSFAVPATCGKPAVPCPAHGVISLRAVVFHPAGKLDVAGQDVGDLLGDTTFMCIVGPNASSAGQQYSQVSMWDLKVWSGFGEYSLCNGYPPVCVGTDNFHVGRETSDCLKPMCGQCANNDNDFGTWYSLGAKGECLQGTAPDGKLCTWQRVQRRKTVSITCPSFKTFFDACQAATSLPLSASASALAQIFASDVVSDGGCPPLSLE